MTLRGNGSLGASWLYWGAPAGPLTQDDNWLVPWQAGVLSLDDVTNRIPVPVAGYVDLLYLQVVGGIVSLADLGITLVLDGGNTSLAATILTGQGAGSDLVNKVAVQPGQGLGLHVTGDSCSINGPLWGWLRYRPT